MRCPKCGAENPDSKRFCGDCGAVLLAATEVPITSNPVDPAALSAELGAELPKAERKTVTALFAEIQGSSDLMCDLDPEEVSAIVNPALRVMIEAVQRYDGYIVQSIGDGILVLFGAPVAYEDHPQRALYAALRLHEELKRYSADLVARGGTPLEARVGVSTGEVVTGTLTTADGRSEYVAFGHAVNLAGRMQSIASNGSIAITENTRRLVEGYFQIESHPRIKGSPELVNVYTVAGPGPLSTRS